MIGLLVMVMVLGWYCEKAYAESHILVDNKPVAWSHQHASNSVAGQQAIPADSVKGHYNIVVISDGKGTVSPAGTITAEQGQVKAFSFLPADGYHVETIRVDGELSETVDSYTFINVSADHVIEVAFSEDNVPPMAFAKP